MGCWLLCTPQNSVPASSTGLSSVIPRRQDGRCRLLTGARRPKPSFGPGVGYLSPYFTPRRRPRRASRRSRISRSRGTARSLVPWPDSTGRWPPARRGETSTCLAARKSAASSDSLTMPFCQCPRSGALRLFRRHARLGKRNGMRGAIHGLRELLLALVTSRRGGQDSCSMR